MLASSVGKVIDVEEEREGLLRVTVETDKGRSRAVVYPELCGTVEIGDAVLINTTATTLNLGSGGYDFVMVNLTRPEMRLEGKGHIMKMRYTPYQIRVLSVEEESSPYRRDLENTEDLEGCPVLVATLHSMVAPLCLALAEKGLKLAYVMTDGASLPLAWSDTVAALKSKGLLAGTVTVGHAFGGDLEAVNIFSGLLAAYGVFKPDVIIVAMGPGIVGTGTKYGFTGVEQGVNLNAVLSLNGTPIAVPRISFSDKRERHVGISHHTLTVLSRVCLMPVILPLPLLAEGRAAIIEKQLEREGLKAKHRLIYRSGEFIRDVIERSGLSITTMGRGLTQDPEFFYALGAAAEVAADLVHGTLLRDI